MGDFEYLILERTRNSEVYIAICEPLAEFHKNLAFCNDREECKELHNRLESFADADELVIHMCCWFCESDEWLVVGVYRDGLMMTLHVTEEFVTEEFGKQIRKLLDELKAKQPAK